MRIEQFNSNPINKEFNLSNEFCDQSEFPLIQGMPDRWTFCL